MTGNREVFEKAMNLGHSAAWEQQWDRAVAYYRHSLEEFPDHPMALTSLGLALFELNDLDAALHVYRHAATAAPADPIPLEKISAINERQGKVNEAVQAAMQAADLQLKARDVAKAIENWQRAIRLQENLAARTRLALVYERMGRKPEAVAEYLASASILQHSGDLVKAMQVAEYALHLMPESLDAQQALTQLRTNQPLPRPLRQRSGPPPKKTAEVHRLEAPAEGASDQDPIAEGRQKALVRLAALLFDQADEDGAGGQAARRGISSLTRGTAGSSTQTAERSKMLLHLGQAIDLQSQGQDALAAGELEYAVNAGLKNVAAYFDLGMLVAEQDGQKALRNLQHSVSHPDFTMASYLLMGRLHLQAERLNDAAVAYLQALRLADAETVPADQADEIQQLYETIIESQARQTDLATLKVSCESIANHLVKPGWRRYMKLAREQLPPQPEGSPLVPLAEVLFETRSSQVLELLTRVRSLASQRKLYSAMEEAYNALQSAPTYLPLHIQIGDLLLQEGRVQDAVEKFLQVARLYSLRGEAGQAIRLLRRVVQIVPMDLNVRNHLIELLLSNGKPEEAIKDYLALGEIYYQLAELDLARQTYMTALRATQQTHQARSLAVQLLGHIADIDLQRLDLRNALRAYEQIRTLAPDDTTTRSHLVDLNFRMGADGTAFAEVDNFVGLLEKANRRAEAIQFMGGLIEDHGDKLELRKRLADLYIRAGQVDKGVEQLDQIADNLLSSGNRAAALTVIQTILTLNPANAADYQRVLEKIRGQG